MTGILLPAPCLRAVDDNGAPIAGAQLQFYLTGTTTPASVYTDDTLGTPLSNPVIADSAGLFVPIFMDPTVTYRGQLLDATGSLTIDMDPLPAAASPATQAQVNAGTASGVYVEPSTLAGWTGVAAALGYTPLNKAGDTATNLVLANSALATASAGYLGCPVNEQDAAYAFVLADAGKMVRGNNGSSMNYTLPANASVAFPVGTAIVVRNVGAGTISIVPASGVTIELAGGATTGTVALAQYGLATMIQESANHWVVSGTGVTI